MAFTRKGSHNSDFFKYFLDGVKKKKILMSLYKIGEKNFDFLNNMWDTRFQPGGTLTLFQIHIYSLHPTSIKHRVGILMWNMKITFFVQTKSMRKKFPNITG